MNKQLRNDNYKADLEAATKVERTRMLQVFALVAFVWV